MRWTGEWQVLSPLQTLGQSAHCLMYKSWKVFLFQKVYSYPVYGRWCEVGQKDLDFGEIGSVRTTLKSCLK